MKGSVKEMGREGEEQLKSKSWEERKERKRKGEDGQGGRRELRM